MRKQAIKHALLSLSPT